MVSPESGQNVIKEQQIVNEKTKRLGVEKKTLFNKA